MSCNKQIYTSFKEAQTIVNLAKKHPHVAGRRINKKKAKIPKRSYWCDECNGYHLTSKSDFVTDEDNKQKKFKRRKEQRRQKQNLFNTNI